jgi:hypothetical protein
VKRHFNFTGRQSIPADMVSAVVQPAGQDGIRSFDLRIGDLASLGLPAGARVYVEPYVKSSSMRFAFGTVGAILPPQDRSLPEIDDGVGVLFRVLVVDETDQVGRLLALADKIAPLGDELQRDAVLPLETRDLGEAVWRLEADKGVQPKLLINNRYPGLKQRLLEDPLMMGAVLPLAVRDAIRVVRHEDDEALEWVKRWRQFVEDVAGAEIAERIFDEGEDDGDEMDEVIDDVCRQLVEKRRYLSRALKIVEALSNG